MGKFVRRTVISKLDRLFFKGKTIVLLGARQVGKTTLLRKYLQDLNRDFTWIDCDNSADRDLLNGLDTTRAPALFRPGTILAIDEAQRLLNTGLSLKIIHDNCPGIQLIATGSSSFELSDKINEAMTGRKRTIDVFPLSHQEVVGVSDVITVHRSLESRLIYGSYPEVVTHPGEEDEILRELSSSYLYKDVFSQNDIRKPEALEKLVKALAFQVGNLISNRELATLTSLDKGTVDRYMDLLEGAFIIFRLRSYSGNLRKELAKRTKIYFIDNGIRNAVNHQFSPLSSRNDVGQLWENYLISERLKLLKTHYHSRKMYFWRTQMKQEIDYLEIDNDHITAFEMKWSAKKTPKFPRTFLSAYPDADTLILNNENYFDFLMPRGTEEIERDLEEE